MITTRIINKRPKQEQQQQQQQNQQQQQQQHQNRSMPVDSRPQKTKLNPQKASECSQNNLLLCLFPSMILALRAGCCCCCCCFCCCFCCQFSHGYINVAPSIAINLGTFPLSLASFGSLSSVSDTSRN